MKLPKKLHYLTQMHSDIKANITPKERKIFISATPMSDNLFSKNMENDQYKPKMCINCGGPIEINPAKKILYKCKNCGYKRRNWDYE